MASVLWIFITLCPLLAHSESGDDAIPDSDYVELSCSSMISLENNNLTCYLDAEDIDDFENATLCDVKQCINGTLNHQSIHFQNLDILSKFELRTHFKDRTEIKQTVRLKNIVKIPTPIIHNITYSSGGALIYIAYNHGYVTHPKYEVEIWEPSLTKNKSFKVEHQPVNIDGHHLGESDIYYVHVRAKPIKYFSGAWTAWSQVKSLKSFKENDPPFVIYIIICTSLILVVGTGWWLVQRWKTVIRAYISPNIPNPKATLAQIQREKERPPVSFSPEIFSDVNINRVDYAEEKQLAPELIEDQEHTSGSCQSEVGGSQPVSLLDSMREAEMSHLKIRLLDESEVAENVVDCQSQTTLQRDCKDESYVTMSSLYKTQ